MPTDLARSRQTARARVLTSLDPYRTVVQAPMARPARSRPARPPELTLGVAPPIPTARLKSPRDPAERAIHPRSPTVAPPPIGPVTTDPTVAKGHRTTPNPAPKSIDCMHQNGVRSPNPRVSCALPLSTGCLNSAVSLMHLFAFPRFSRCNLSFLLPLGKSGFFPNIPRQVDPSGWAMATVTIRTGEAIVSQTPKSASSAAVFRASRALIWRCAGPAVRLWARRSRNRIASGPWRGVPLAALKPGTSPAGIVGRH